jgi:hypothetical protein
MKRFLLAVSLVLIMISVVFGAVTKSTGILTSSSSIARAAGQLTGVLVITDGTNAATITLYDSTSSASGTVLFTATVPGTAYFGGATWEIPVRYTTGVYAVISGTGAKYIVYIQGE